MDADSLYNNIKSYLRLTTRVVSKTGRDINVKEKFTIRFTVFNSAYSGNADNKAKIIFLNPKIYVKETYFAKPVNGNSNHAFPDAKLQPNESSSIDIEFVALRDFRYHGWVPGGYVEPVAQVWLKADLDQNKFFEIRDYSLVQQDIVRT